MKPEIIKHAHFGTFIKKYSKQGKCSRFAVLTWSPLVPLGPCCPRGPGSPCESPDIFKKVLLLKHICWQICEWKSSLGFDTYR